MKRQTQIRRLLIFLFSVLLLISISCSKQEEEGRISPKQETDRVDEPNYADILGELELIQNEIRKDPANSELHAKLIDVSIDTKLGLVWAAGRGEEPTNARSPVIAQQAAQEAAYIDACQWIAYLLEWREHPGKPEFGKIHADLPGARLVHKVIVGNETKVLVETNLP